MDEIAEIMTKENGKTLPDVMKNFVFFIFLSAFQNILII